MRAIRDSSRRAKSTSGFVISTTRSRKERFSSRCRSSSCAESRIEAGQPAETVYGRQMMTLAWLALFDGMIAIALAGAGIISAHFGITPSIIGFQIFLLGFFVSAIGLILGIIAILVTWLSK